MTSQLLQYLPALYQSQPFLNKGLLAFEKILLGRIDHETINFTERGLEEQIAELSTLFDPQQTPREFLSWLAGWVGFNLRNDLPELSQRQFIANAVQNYRYRGTKVSLQNLLEIFLVGAPVITEEPERPHFFRVTISFPVSLQGNAQELGWQLAMARSIIDLEKPAHTQYELEPLFPSLQVGERSTIGINTLLGTVPASNPS